MSGAAAGLGTWFADWLLLVLAGGVGAACRWGVNTSVSRLSGRAAREAVTGGQQWRRSGSRVPWMPRTPWGMVIVNVTAYLFMGPLVGRTADPPRFGTWAAAALTTPGTGFLGGYSVSSTAYVEGARLLLVGRRGPVLAHAILMMVVTPGAVGLGLAVGAAPCQSTTQPGSRLTPTKISQATRLRVEYEDSVGACGSENARRRLRGR